MLKPELLLQYERAGIVEQQHFGHILLIDKEKIIKEIGRSEDYPIFWRSCAKPLQASLLIDFDVINHFDLSLEELAFCCSSHTGEKVHIKCARSIMKKTGIKMEHLKCPPHPPLDEETRNELLTNKKKATPLHNNCSGKHLAMLAVCLKNNWNTLNYLDKNHPLQKAMHKKITELCEIGNKQELIPNTPNPVFKPHCAETPLWGSLDGCGAPIWAASLHNLGLGFLNLFTDKKYCAIKEAMLRHPYLIGGNQRLDTTITGANLIAKVGASGLCAIINLKTEQALVIKISDANTNARAIVVINALMQLGWLDDKFMKSPLNILFDKIVTLENEVVGEIKPVFGLC